MAETVGCAECGASYDSQENAFCPRCGAMGRKPDLATLHVADPPSPRRRRIQIAGIMSLTIGLLMGLVFAVALAIAPTMLEGSLELAADQPGGMLEVQVLSNGTAVPEAHVEVTAGGEPYLMGRTDADGIARFDLSKHMVVNITLGVDGKVFERRVLALPEQTQVVTIDIATAPHSGTATEGAAKLVQATRILSGVLLAASLFNVLGGVMAIRRRNRAMAISGTAVGGIAPLLLMFAVPGIGSFLLLGVVAASIAIMVANRDQFRS